MELNLLISFMGASLFLILMPGPDNIFVLTESLTKGKRNGMAISIGLSGGIVIHTLAAATGLSFIIQKSAVAFSVVKYLGAAYLLYMAISALKDKRLSVNEINKNTAGNKNFLQLVRKGLFMNVLNPKVSLFFIAFFPQFITPEGINPTLQLIILGGIFMALATVFFLSVSALSGKLAKYLNSERFWKVTKWSKVTVLSLLGISLALSRK